MFAFLVSDLGTLVKCVCVFVYAWDIHVCVNSSYTDIFLLEVLRWEIGVDLYLLLVHCDVDALCLEPGPHRQVRPTCC